VIILKNHGEDGSEQVRFRPLLEPLDDIGRLLASLRFEQRGRLDQLGVNISSIEKKSANFGSPR